MSQRKPFPLTLPPDLRERLDSIVARKRSVELYSARECNLQTETASALRVYLESEEKRLATVQPPTKK